MPQLITDPHLPSPKAGEIVPLRLPNPGLFAQRAGRLRQLALDHGLGDYLRLAADLADVQPSLLDHYPALPQPRQEFLELCRAHKIPPLAPGGWTRDPGWRDALPALAAALTAKTPAATASVLRRLAEAGPEWIEAQADRLLNGDAEGLDLAAAPFIGAALQSYWTSLAACLDPDQLSVPETPGFCPVCGSPPVMAVIRAGTNDQGLRYLHCSLCNSQWHRVRAQCSQCGSDRGLGYYHVEGRPDDPVRAEACSSCHGYLKLLDLQKAPFGEPQADDLASMALDLLMAEQGYEAIGLNYWMLGGAVVNG